MVTGLVSFTERESPAFKFYQELNKNYGLPADWNPLNLLGISQGLLTVRAVEHAARKVGAAKLTGEAVYDALANGTYADAEFYGFMSGFSFNKEAPFPSMNARVKIETVKDGKMVLATPQGVPVVSDITKW